ncbi:transcription factor SPEECHLESS isoform X1 [Oryza sativa Japonica Group]|uniref:transcription factor SPEECHLESS isoform X1 n=1 Tax=Oryza sativa subsp. japonica TaxID=39947 RepID=UPI0001A70278
MGDALCDQLLLVDSDGGEFIPHHADADADDLFTILETWEGCANVVAGGAPATTTTLGSPIAAAACISGVVGGQNHQQLPEPAAAKTVPATNNKRREEEVADRDGDGDDDDGSPQKRRKCCSPESSTTDVAAATTPKTAHIAVERNRRKQMNENLAVLRSLMPCFYVKRGDQASIIGGVVDYIKELQQVLHSLEAKKQRKVYTDQVLSPRPPATVAASCCSPRPPQLSPRLPPQLLKSTPPLSPRLAVPISPRTPPTPGSPYRLLRLPPPPPPASGSNYASPAMTPTHHETAAPSLDAIAAELSAYASRQALGGGLLLPDVKVEFAGANLVLKTVSQRSPGQAVKIIAALEGRSLEILHAKISTVDDTAVNSFTVKYIFGQIGIECELSAEELVQVIQQTFT